MHKEQVIALRQRTGAGVMDIRRALQEAAGDVVRAEALIRERRQGQNHDQPTAAGAIFSAVHANRIGALIELRCATDFVARTTEFQELGRALALQVIGANPGDLDAFLQGEMLSPAFERATVAQLLADCSARVAEPVQVARLARFEVPARFVRPE